MNRLLFKSTIIILLIVLFSPLYSYSGQFKKEGNYSINLDGWIRNSMPEGDAFTCSKCDEQIQVQITYGPYLNSDARFRNNKEIIAAFKEKSYQKDFAMTMMKNSVPPGFDIDVARTGLSKIGGLDVFQYQAIVKMGGKLSYETSMIAIQKNRVVKVTLNYFDGAMNKTNGEYINSLLGSLKFIK